MSFANSITDVEALIERSADKKDSLADKVELSAFYILNQEYDLALRLLMDIIETDVRYSDDYARNSIQKVFVMLGVEHELVKKYRSSLKKLIH